MKFRLTFLVLISLIFIFSNLGVPQTIKKDTYNKVKNKKDLLNKLESRKKSLKNEREKFLKLYIALYIKKLYKKDVYQFFKESDYLVLLSSEERFKLIEKALIKKMLNLKKEEEAIEVAYNKILKDIERGKQREKLEEQKAYAINPLDGKPIKLGSHILKAKGPLSVLAPIAGIVKGIVYKQNHIRIVIENEKCKAIISGLDDVLVSAGESVLRKQIIGSIKENKNLSFSVDCKETVFSKTL
ncbi:MAG: hypothetical protein C0190_03010 [Thermodesulfobacterium geofontis]|uniref:Uncharacterized protein n=1 Tax=Thermodesulfobacterium geofontis TaxID=1295609 RepID=A0A2N7PP08_9BACT|nr:MAG: hypothetical protein C0190_03010 [Thermodesulfobacterium geofontis]